MPINKTHEEENKMVLELTGGDLTAFREIMERWNAKDEACLIHFMMSAMIATKTNRLGIDKGFDAHWITIPDHLTRQQ